MNLYMSVLDFEDCRLPEYELSHCVLLGDKQR